MSHDHSQLDRRCFVRNLAIGTGATAFAAATAQARPAPKATRYPVCCFAKPLQHMTFDALADFLQPLGFQGIEATVRKGGQVEPERVEQDLPKLVDALRRRGLEITIMATDINRADQPLTAKVLETAARLGIKRYRFKAYHYDLSKPILPQLATYGRALRDLAALNRALGITGLYQNHSGKNYVGAPVWDIYNAVRPLPPAQAAIAFDIRHATVEGGLSWPIQFNLVRSHMAMVYVKDFVWDGRKPKNVPLGQGMVDPHFFKMLAATSFTGPISLHIEYFDHRNPTLAKQREQAVANDIKTLRKLLADARASVLKHQRKTK